MTVKFGRTHLYDNLPLEDLLLGPEYYFDFVDDFTRTDTFVSDSDPAETKTTAGWTFTQVSDSSSAYTIADVDGGHGLLTVVSTTANQGCQLQRGAEFVKITSMPLWYSARVFVYKPKNSQLFVGLCERDTTIFASGAVSTSNYVGFVLDVTSQAAGAGKLKFVSCKAGTATTVSDVYTFPTDPTEYITVGFRTVNDGTKIEAFVNGELVATVTSNIPVLELTPSFAINSHGTNAPYEQHDWVRVTKQRRAYGAGG